uniref:Uncharacterized protein n=1 Tax=Erwinia amylovora ATCC BAA-2158 TaxID=889211 RepID=E5BAM7_ERWAM|nr:hypothetical protein predicted by Glimmer/Critica [Erwinia amylovora ATCC BAA-2158]
MGAYHQQLRLTIARQRLRQDIGSERAARSAGFSSSRQLHSTRNAGSSVFFTHRRQWLGPPVLSP